MMIAEGRGQLVGKRRYGQRVPDGGEARGRLRSGCLRWQDGCVSYAGQVAAAVVDRGVTSKCCPLECDVGRSSTIR